jgi:hypothetical protein
MRRRESHAVVPASPSAFAKLSEIEFAENPEKIKTMSPNTFEPKE